jgi:hypothetical protein
LIDQAFVAVDPSQHKVRGDIVRRNRDGLLQFVLSSLSISLLAIELAQRKVGLFLVWG